VPQPSFLIIRLGSLGDVIHGIPAAAALRQHFPDARLDWVVDPKYVELLSLVEGLDRCIPFNPRDLLKGAQAWTMLGDLRKTQYDAVIDLQGLLKSAVLARLAGGRRTIGFSKPHLREPQASALYTETIDPGSAPHVIDKALGLVRAVGVTTSVINFPLRIPRTAVAATVATRFGGDGYTLMNPGAAWPNKRWPPARFGAVAAALQRERGLRSLVMWGPGEESLALAAARASSGAAEVAPPAAIADIVAIAHGARVMVSGDTGPLHIAGAVGTPLVALFGPTSAERNGPWAKADVTLSQVAGCSCVYERRCRRATPCIDEISIDAVVDAVRRRMDGHG
jgi:heptosyltransferase-1